MGQLVVLLRGINVGKNKQVPMANLRELLSGAGYEDVRTHLRSGNVLVRTARTPGSVAEDLERVIEGHFGFPVPIVVRTLRELEQVVAADPFGAVADDPARQAVAFLSAKPDAAALAKLEAIEIAPDRLVADGRELHLWHPDGLSRGVLSKELARATLGVTVTVRNWRTTTTLLTMMREPE